VFKKVQKKSNRGKFLSPKPEIGGIVKKFKICEEKKFLDDSLLPLGMQPNLHIIRVGGNILRTVILAQKCETIPK
jgi:hypothetical protein